MLTRNALLTLAVLCLPGALAGCGRKLHPRGDDAPSRNVGDEQGHAAAGVGATASLRLLETTDLHVNMESFDYYRNQPTLNTGLVRAATVLRRARAAAKNSLTIDNGDLLQGAPLGDFFHKARDPKTAIHTVYKAMNLIGYDVANLGNHDFNYGLDFMQASIHWAKFEYVSANVVANGAPAAHTPYIKPYTILTRDITTDDGKTDQVKIGVIGFVTPQIMQWDRSNLLGKVDAEDIVDTAARLVPQMQAEGAQIIVAVPHSGISALPRAGKDENAVYYLAAVPGIDAILCGHSHKVFPSKDYATVPEADLDAGKLRGVATVMAGFWGSHVGVVDLQLKKGADGWHVAASKGSVLEVQKELTPADFEPDVRDAVAADHQATLTYLQQPVGSATRPIGTFYSEVQPSLAVEVVQQAQQWYVEGVIARGGADVAALAGLPLLSASAPYNAGATPVDYTDVAAGTITLRDVAALYVYPNTLKVVKISGATLADWLEMSAGALNQIKPGTNAQPVVNTSVPAYNFDSILGVSYGIDLSRPARFTAKGKLVDAGFHRVVGLTYRGAPVDPAQCFLVITNNYRANGGGNFPGLDGTQTVLDPNKENRQVVSEYVTAVGAVGGDFQDHWRLVPVPGATNVILRSSPLAKDRVAETNGLLQYVSTNVDGYASYKLLWPAAPSL